MLRILVLVFGMTFCQLSVLAQGGSLEIDFFSSKSIKIKCYINYLDKTSQKVEYNFKQGSSTLKLNLEKEIVSLKINYYNTSDLSISKIRIFSTANFDLSIADIINSINLHNGLKFSVNDDYLEITSKNINSGYVQFLFSNSHLKFLTKTKSKEEYVKLLIDSDDDFVIRNVISVDSAIFFQNSLITKGLNEYSFDLTNSEEKQLELSVHRQYRPNFSIRRGLYISMGDTIVYDTIIEQLQLNYNLEVSDRSEDTGVTIKYCGDQIANSILYFDFIKKNLAYSINYYGRCNSPLYFQSSLSNNDEVNEQHQSIHSDGNFILRFDHYLAAQPTSFFFDIRPDNKNGAIELDSIIIEGFRGDGLKQQVWHKSEIESFFKVVKSPTTLDQRYLLKSSFIFDQDAYRQKLLILILLIVSATVLFYLNSFFARSQ